MKSIRAEFTLLIIVAAACFAASIVAPAIPFISAHYSMKINQPSMMMSVYLCGYLLGQIIYSFISKSKSPKIALTIGFKIFIIGATIQIASIYNYSIILLFLGRFITALGASSGLVCVFAIINEMYSKEESKKLISLAFISLTSFAYLSMTFSGIIISYFGWEVVFYFTLFISIFYFYLIKSYITSSKLKVNALDKHTILITISYYFQSLRNFKLVLASMIVAFTTTTTYIYNCTAAMISSQYFHFSANHFGMCSLLNFFGLIIGGYLSSILIKKYTPLNAIIIGLTVVAFPLIVFAFFTNTIVQNQSSIPVFFIFTAILNIGLGIIYPSGSYLALNTLDCSATASSIMNFIKIGCPTIVLAISSTTNLSTIDSFQVPLFVSFLATLLFWAILAINESYCRKLKNQSVRYSI